MSREKKALDPKIGIVGGQAVLEGVMMKSGDRCSLAVRTPEGKISLYNVNKPSVRSKHKIARLPLIRGIVAFVEQMALSMDMLTRSADMQGIDLDEPETKFEKWLNDKFGDKLMNVITAIGTVLGLVVGVGLFLMLPTFAAKGIGALTGGFIGEHAVLRSLVEGLIRIAIFIAYVWGVSLMPDIRRTYEYHGAEHKSVACFEAGLDLTPENARGCTRFHCRCGTSLIFVMLRAGTTAFLLGLARQTGRRANTSLAMSCLYMATTWRRMPRRRFGRKTCSRSSGGQDWTEVSLPCSGAATRGSSICRARVG